MSEEVTITTPGADWLCKGIQLAERKFVPQWLGRFIIWMFFHRQDTATSVKLYGFREGSGL